MSVKEPEGERPVDERQGEEAQDQDERRGRESVEMEPPLVTSITTLADHPSPGSNCAPGARGRPTTIGAARLRVVPILSH